MSTDDIDDFFRQQLDGHATPPGDALWARLQAAPPAADELPAADRLDALFEKTLARHATPPPRALWERLEDEHLRPRKRRAAAWWPLALAAAVALLLVAGGAGLWLNASLKSTRGGLATTAPPQRTLPKGTGQWNTATPTPSAAENRTEAVAMIKAGPSYQNPAAASPGRGFEKKQPARATRAGALASTAPKAAATQPWRPRKGVAQQSDAAADQPRLVARTAAQPTPLPQPATPDEGLPQPAPAPAVALATQPAPAPAAATAAALPAAGLASAGELITVDVRSGAAGALRTTTPAVTALAAAGAPAERRLGGRLLLQVGHLVRGERLSLTEATGLSRNLTLQATVGGHRLTKSIQL